MEELSFKRVFGILSEAKAELPVLPTVFFLEQKNLKYRSGTSQRVMEQSLTEESIESYLKKLAVEYEHIDKLKMRSQVICFVEDKGEKKGIKKRDLEGSVNGVSGLKYLQFPISSEQHIFLVFGLMFSSSGYTTSLNYCSDQSQCSLTDVFEKAADISKVLISLVEKSTQKKVLVFNIELALVNNESVYFSGIRSAKVYPADELAKEHIRDSKDIEKLLKKGKQMTVPNIEGLGVKSRFIRSGKRKETEVKMPILPLEGLLGLPPIQRKNIKNHTAIMKYHESKLTEPTTMNNHFLELVSKTNVKLKSKYRSNHDEDIRREVARIFKMMSKYQAEKPAIATKETSSNEPFTPITIAINGINSGDLPKAKKSSWLENIEPLELTSKKRSWFGNLTSRSVTKTPKPVIYESFSSILGKRQIELRKKYLQSS